VCTSPGPGWVESSVSDGMGFGRGRRGLRGGPCPIGV